MTCAPFPNSYGLTRKASCIVSAAPANGDSINTPGLSLLTKKQWKNIIKINSGSKYVERSLQCKKIIVENYLYKRRILLQPNSFHLSLV